MHALSERRDPWAVERERSLRHAVYDSAGQAFMMGAGEAYIVPFAVFLGAGNLLIGLLASGPLLIGALVQVWVVEILDRAPSRRRLVIVPVLIQALSFIPLFCLPWLVPNFKASMALVGVLLYYAAGSLMVPAYASWLGELIPPERRGRFFGRRDRIAVAVQLASILIAGLTLSAARPAGYERAGFAVVFGLALTARLFSVYHLSRLVEPPYPAPPSHERFSLLDFVRSSPWANFGRFSIYMAIFLAATNMAAPYFAPFMLKDLHFDYGDFTLASCAFLTAQSVTLTNWGRVADRFGSRRVLQFTGLGLPLVPILWLVSTHLVFILVIQLIAGFLWAGFYLSAANFFFDAVPPTKRTRSVAYHSAFTNTGMVVGALTGGWIAEHLPAELPGKLAPLFPRLELISPLQVIFLASGLVRLLVSLSLLPKIREAREVPAVSHWQVIVQIIGLTAIRGMLVSVFTGVHPSETPAPPPVKQREPPRSS